MSRAIHLLGEGGQAACCGKTMAALGFGAVLTDDVASVTCQVVDSLKQREGDQPLPVVNDEPDIQSQVIADIEERREVGIQRYGTALQPFNGRSAERDFYEEMLDGTMYAKQLLIEREALEARIADLQDTIAVLQAERSMLVIGWDRRKYMKAQGIAPPSPGQT